MEKFSVCRETDVKFTTLWQHLMMCVLISNKRIKINLHTVNFSVFKSTGLFCFFLLFQLSCVCLDPYQYFLALDMLLNDINSCKVIKM